MTKEQILSELAAYGSQTTKTILQRHGAKEPFFGVKVQDLKKILKKTGKNHALALSLYATGNSDAMYLASLMADEHQMTKVQLQEWVQEAYWYMLSEYAVAWVAAESPFGFELGLSWIASPTEQIAAAGWATLSSIAALRPDEQLDIPRYRRLLQEVEDGIHQAQNRVRYAMNGFIIATGGYIAELTEPAMQTARAVGVVQVNMGATECKVPLATVYLQKVIDKGKIGKKRKTARC